MAQGQHKPKSVGKLNKIQKKPTGRIQRGQRKAPKSQGAIKEKLMQKKLSARNIQNTERQMSIKAASTGKLTILKSTADLALKEKKLKEAKKA